MGLSTKNFSDLITFTRASTGRYFNSSGVLTSAAIDTPRFNYNPATLAARGLLLEESRTNSLLYSEEFDNVYWNKGNLEGTLTANSTTAPDGATTAELYQENTVTTGRYITRSNSFTSGLAYTVSVFAKQAPGATRYAGLVLLSGAFGVSVTAVFTLSGAGSVTIVTAGTGTSASIQQCANGWYRCTLTSTATVTTSANIQIRLTNSPSGIAGYTGDGSSGIYIWGVQLEAGASASSYIPTSASTVTRAADSATLSTLSNWFNTNEGTILGQFDNYATGTRTVVDINNSTANESIRLRSIATNPYFTVTDGGSDQADLNGGALVANTSCKFAGAYRVNDFAACINGGTVQTDTSGTLPTVTQMILGNSASSNILNGHLQKIVYYPCRLSDSELQTATT